MMMMMMMITFFLSAIAATLHLERGQTYLEKCPRKKYCG